MPLYFEGEVEVERRGTVDPDGSRYCVLDFGGCTYDSPEMKAARLFAGNTEDHAMGDAVFESMRTGAPVALRPYEISTDRMLSGQVVVLNFTRSYGARVAISIFGSWSDEYDKRRAHGLLDETESDFAAFTQKNIEKRKAIERAWKKQKRR